MINYENETISRILVDFYQVPENGLVIDVVTDWELGVYGFTGQTVVD